MRDVALTYVGAIFRSPCNWRSGAPNPGNLRFAIGLTRSDLQFLRTWILSVL